MAPLDTWHSLPSDPSGDGRGRRLFKSWPVVATALAGLLLLVVVSILAARRKTQEVYTQLDEVHMLHRHVEAKLRRLRSDIHLSGIFMRDYLLDNSHLTGPYYRERLTDLRQVTTATIAELERTVGDRQGERIESLRQRLDDYWQAFDPLFDWTPAEKMALSSVFLRREVLPRRDAVLAIAQAIEEFNNANILEQRTEVASREKELHGYLNRMLALSLFLGAIVAVAAVFRINVLEKRWGEQNSRAENAEAEMRRLSQQLVKAQEEERRNLSRELHDEVGQTLTALRMEFGKAEKSKVSPNGTFESHISECKHLVESLIQTVRHLAMGLRPSMLDDLGLRPALEWQARDFSRRYNVPVNVTIEDVTDDLPEPYRTAVYRVTQEALTNCARHAKATQISVSLRGVEGRLRLLVHDDGVGVAKRARPMEGFGLLGIQERVRELGGEMSLLSTEGAGATLKIEIPLEPDPAEREHAHRTG